MYSAEILKNAADLAESAIRIKLDVNGNPRYYVPFFLFPIMSDKTRLKAGLNKYRGKAYGRGYVLQSYDIQGDLAFALDTIAKAG